VEEVSDVSSVFDQRLQAVSQYKPHPEAVSLRTSLFDDTVENRTSACGKVPGCKTVLNQQKQLSQVVCSRKF
jgi:hypothetical protein